MTYAIRVDGHLDDHWSARLGDLDMTRDRDGRTTLTLPNADQAQLHGVLAGLRDIGAVITELRAVLEGRGGGSVQLGAFRDPGAGPGERAP